MGALEPMTDRAQKPVSRICLVWLSSRDDNPQSLEPPSIAKGCANVAQFWFLNRKENFIILSQVARTQAKCQSVLPELSVIAASLLAARKLEATYLSAPVEGPAALEVFIGVEERAIIARVDADAAVVPPPVQVRELRTGAGFQARFRLERSRGVAWDSSCITDAGKDAPTGSAVPDCDIPGLVHTDAAHPSEGTVR